MLDDGEGVPLAIRDRLFQPFVSTRGKGGLGLGLQTSRRIVERHNGHIRYDDRDGGGSRFSITLPRAAGPPNQAVLSGGSMTDTYEHLSGGAGRTRFFRSERYNAREWLGACGPCCSSTVRRARSTTSR